MKQNQQVSAYLLEQNLVHFLARHSLTILRVALGVIYLWFGALKFFPGLSPAEDLALRTIDSLTFGLLPAAAAAVLLALLECTIGLGFLTGKYMRLTLLLMAFQMAGATSPLFLFPQETLGSILVAPTLEGQYIIKNLVLIGAALVIASTVRGGCLVAEPYQRERNLAVNGQADSTVTGQQRATWTVARNRNLRASAYLLQPPTALTAKATALAAKTTRQN